MEDYTKMWVEHHTATGKDYMRSGFVTNDHHQDVSPPTVHAPTAKKDYMKSGFVTNDHHQDVPPPTVLAPTAKKTKPKVNNTWKMVVKLKHEGGMQTQPESPIKGELMDTDTRYNLAVANMQVGKMMMALKNPETNQTYWQCTECNYFNKSAKSSKFKVKTHVLKHHVESLGAPERSVAEPLRVESVEHHQAEPAWKSHTWMDGGAQAKAFGLAPYNGNHTPTIQVSESPYDPVASHWTLPSNVVTAKPDRLTSHQVATMMRTLKDGDSGQSYWQCTECNFFSANPKSSKFKVERHILKQHLGTETSDTLWMEGEPITMTASLEYQTPTARVNPQPYLGPTTPSTPNTPRREKTEEEKEAETRMWSIKDPETGKTFWRCAECEYSNKSDKCSKGKVRTHVLNHHMGRLSKNTPDGTPSKKEKTELDLQVESFMGSIKDPATRRVIWLCTKCNYSQSRTGKSKSCKDKMKRHILRKHIEGGQLIAREKFCQAPNDPTKTIARFNY